LLTGGAGFIGSHLARAILAIPEFQDHGIVILDDLSGGFQENIPQSPRVTLIRGSITDDALVKEAFRRYRFRFVYHLAAYAAEGLSHFIRHFNYTNNLIGSVNLINASINFGVECFIFTSSIAVYGAAQVPMQEDMAPQPEDPYGIAKYAIELDLKAARAMFGMNYVIFRPHNVYGEYQNIGDLYRNVVGIFMNQILQGKPMTIFGDGGQQRAFSYIGDIAPILARPPLVSGARNRVFNIGADQVYTVNELALRVGEAMGVNPTTVHLPARQEVGVAFSDHSACTEVFGQQTQTPLEEGLQRMAAWVKTVGARKSREFENIELQKNLPGRWVKQA
ncbi:MAG: NAD-dependent epimerase/dehydratase family protein, partial [Deltaproteobacteria bacterium]|nr:NAD-dependent epimerase/dehydratase family protein [Deltaproteobacteria bacterium]